MLRAGRLIETGRLDVLRRLASLHVRAELDGAVPDLSGFAGVTEVKVVGSTVDCDLAGPMEPVMRVLAEAGIRHLTTREPSLEELFLSHYGTATTPGHDGR
jgi:ABC-2 type transport system ATP-binding protein